MSRKSRLDEYTKLLLEQREKEEKKEDPLNHFQEKSGTGLTSPHSAMSSEELRVFMKYKDHKNLLAISEGAKERKKFLILKEFLKSKRNQPVEILYFNPSLAKIEAKVSTIGRDFVMVTDLRKRIWIPYNVIQSATIPYDVPNYSNTHQHFIYDNDLRSKLLRNFGSTVHKRGALVQQFYEETLHTNLQSWKKTMVRVVTPGKSFFGRIEGADTSVLRLKLFNRTQEISIKEIHSVETLRFLQFIGELIKFRR
ncbi:hypothetical protein [Bacillus infantis]|uniref:hypothetical protein n=1 Tax=Bacillus infantis TaxID=324767 RepID=UPI0021554751|nr:hypothetical protein [Bacillus infantis]MCR6609026.1 hypothetical protein [Bacillus infantis]